jgi:hypothetical protein
LVDFALPIIGGLLGPSYGTFPLLREIYPRFNLVLNCIN